MHKLYKVSKGDRLWDEIGNLPWTIELQPLNLLPPNVVNVVTMNGFKSKLDAVTGNLG